MSKKIANIPQKNEKYVVKIVDYGANGEGIAKIEGFAVFVPFAIVGETVEINIIYAKKDFAVGKIVKIVEASSDRRNAPCPYFGKCGGCQLQHIEYERQLEIKRNMVDVALRKYANYDGKVETCVPSDKEFGYRNKFSFPVTKIDGKVCVGMYRPASHDIVKIDNCLLQEDCKQIVDCFCEFASQNNLPVVDEKTKNGIKHLVVRTNGDSLLFCVVSTEKISKLHNILPKLQKIYKNVHIVNNINTLDNNVILGNKDIVVAGTGELEYDEFGLVYGVNVHSFLQVNSSVKKKIYDAVLENIDLNDNVIDAYSGAGVLSCIMAQKCKKVVAIEIVKEAIADANRLARINKIENVKNICGDCAKILPQVNREFDANVIVLDPPRKGCDKSVVDSVIEAAPQKIIYVSCNPATLARDVSLLADKYEIEKVVPFDMFPQTANVETLLTLKKK